MLPASKRKKKESLLHDIDHLRNTTAKVWSAIHHDFTTLSREAYFERISHRFGNALLNPVEASDYCALGDYIRGYQWPGLQRKIRESTEIRELWVDICACLPWGAQVAHDTHFLFCVYCTILSVEWRNNFGEFLYRLVVNVLSGSLTQNGDAAGSERTLVIRFGAQELILQPAYVPAAEIPFMVILWMLKNLPEKRAELIEDIFMLEHIRYVRSPEEALAMLYRRYSSKSTNRCLLPTLYPEVQSKELLSLRVTFPNAMPPRKYDILSLFLYFTHASGCPVSLPPNVYLCSSPSDDRVGNGCVQAVFYTYDLQYTRADEDYTRQHPVAGDSLSTRRMMDWILMCNGMSRDFPYKSANWKWWSMDIKLEESDVKKIFDRTRDRKAAYPIVPLGGYDDILGGDLKPLAGQLKTLEFMDWCEKTPFIDGIYIRPTVPSADGEVTISPWTEMGYHRHSIVVWQDQSYMRAMEQIRGGIIANETGTGKTLTAYLRCLAETPVGETNLIVVPDILIHQWREQALKTTATCLEIGAIPVVDGVQTVMFLHGSTAPHIPTKKPTVLVVTHRTLRSSWFQKTYLRRWSFLRLIVDEAHSIKVGSAILKILTEISRDVTFAISATPWGLARIKAILKILRVDQIKANLTHLIWPIFLHFTIRTARDDRDTLKVVKHVHYGVKSEAETEFHASIIRVLHEQIFTHRNYGTDAQRARVYRLICRIGAGGYLHQAVYMELIRNMITSKPNVRVLEIASTPAITDKHDSCPVCLGVVEQGNPVQLECGHVVCSICLDSLLGAQVNTCVMRDGCSLRGKIFRPSWYVQEEKEEEEKEDAVVHKKKRSAEEAMLDRVHETKEATRTDFQALVAGAHLEQLSEEYRSGVIHCRGKLEMFFQRLTSWISEREVGDQLVVFTDEHNPSQEVVDRMREFGLRVLCAGLGGVKRAESAQNIEIFRGGEGDVLVLTKAFSYGIDLNKINELWIYNADPSSAVTEQQIGRIQRVGQKHQLVNIRFFAYRNWLDDYIYQHGGKQQSVTSSKSSFIGFVSWSLRADKRYPFYYVYQVQKELRRLGSRWTIDATPRSDYHSNDITLRLRGNMRVIFRMYSNSTWIHFRLDGKHSRLAFHPNGAQMINSIGSVIASAIGSVWFD